MKLLELCRCEKAAAQLTNYRVRIIAVCLLFVNTDTDHLKHNCIQTAGSNPCPKAPISSTSRWKAVLLKHCSAAFLAAKTTAHFQCPLPAPHQGPGIS